MATKKITVFVPFELEILDDDDSKKRLHYCLSKLRNIKMVVETSAYHCILKRKCKVSDMQIIIHKK